jgi:hypothetical protein
VVLLLVLFFNVSISLNRYYATTGSQVFAVIGLGDVEVVVSGQRLSAKTNDDKGFNVKVCCVHVFCFLDFFYIKNISHYLFLWLSCAPRVDYENSKL